MALTIGDTAPDFTAETTEGKINFHDWIGDGWAVLFSHPRDFTPVCTTELGYMATIKPDFDKPRHEDHRPLGRPVDNHEKWVADIERRHGTAPNYPIIADTDFAVAKPYGMLPADVPATRPSAPPPRTRRCATSSDRSGQEDQARPDLPDDHRPQLRRGPARHRLAAAHLRHQLARPPSGSPART